MKSKYSTPILTTFYNFIAVILPIAAVVAVISEEFWLAIVLMAGAIMSAGIAQAVALLAKTAYNSQRTADLLEQKQIMEWHEKQYSSQVDHQEFGDDHLGI